MIKLLILIPMYNAEKFISECLSSIFTQGINMKIVVIDDASTDKSLLLASKYNIELIKNTNNMGTYYSINAGLKYASNDLTWTHYTIHGADDISLPGRFSRQLSLFSSGALAVGCGFSRVNFHSKKVMTTNLKTNESTLIFSRKVFDSIGYYENNRVGSDTEYKKRLLLKFPNSIKSADTSLIKSYIHGNNLTQKIPLGGSHRKKYVSEFTKKHQIMMKNKDFYQSFITH